MGMGFQFEQYRLGLWDLSWDLKKTISWEMGLGPPPSRSSNMTPADQDICTLTKIRYRKGKLCFKPSVP